MVVHRKKKVRKLRGRGMGSHGWGARKKHRGAGSRGGRGRAGLSGKKGQQKAGLAHKMKIKRGKRGLGFKQPKILIKKEKIINLKDVEKNIDNYLKEKIAIKKKNKFEIDLSKLGYTKLLGSGKLNNSLIIKVKNFSKNAEKKIKEKKGEIIKIE